MKRRYGLISMACIIAVVISQLTCNMFGQGEYFVRRAYAAEYQSVQGELELGKPLMAELDWQVCREALFEFVPPETDTYVFYSMSDDATAANLYTYSESMETMVLLESDGMRSGRNENFSLECELTGGKRYYFGALYAESATKVGSFQVAIRKQVKEEEMGDQPELQINQDGLDYEISSEGEYAFAQFVPPEDGYYILYTKNFCGKAGVCDENCGCVMPCDCLSETALTVYEKGENEKLRTLYFADAGSSGGVVLYNYFEKNKTYYIEIGANDYKKTGKFKLYSDIELNHAPVDVLEPGKPAERFINGSQDALIYKIVPENTAKYRLSSHGLGLYMTLFDAQRQEILAVDDYYDGFDEKIQLEAGQSYYIILRANTLQTYSLSLLLEELPPEPSAEPSSEPAESNAPVGTEKPAESDVPTGTEKPIESNAPIGTEEPAESNAPIGTEKPAESNAPIGTGKPAESSTPSGTEKPTESGTPSGTGKPTESGTPSGTGEPAESTTPIETGEPAESGTPLETGEPTESSTPLETGEPTGSNAPLATEMPTAPTGTAGPAESGSSSGTDTLSVPNVQPDGNENKGAAISIKDVVVVPVNDQVYTGKNLSPVIRLTYQGIVLEENKDYEVSYTNNKKIGKGTITITGKGAYTDQRDETFNIVPGKAKIKKGKRNDQKLSLTWKKVKGATNYEIIYSYSPKFKKSKKKTVKKCKAVLKVKTSKKCYVKIRAYKKVNKIKYYGEMSKTKKC